MSVQNQHMTRDELGKGIYEIARLEGEFKLRSGKISNIYFDKYRFEAQPQLLSAIANYMAPLLPMDTEVLGGLEMGGIPIATALSLKTGLPVAFLRKEAKTYGTCQFAEGVEVKNKKVVLIEDVITTGGAVYDTTQMLRDIGATVTEVVCVIDRSEGNPSKVNKAQLKMTSLYTMEQLLGFAK